MEDIRKWADVRLEVRRAPNGRAALGTVWRYILFINERLYPERRARDILVQLVEAVGAEHETKEDLMSLAERLQQEAREEGLQLGRQETLLKVLRVRFGSLPEDAVAKVHAAGLAELDAWLERIFSASSLGDVLAPT